MMQSEKLLSKRWSSCPSQLIDIRKSISDVCRQLKYSENDINTIVLAIDEACTNIIRYAYKNCADGEILIEASADDKQLIVNLHDHASKVSKDCIKIKPSPQLEPGGLGVKLMHEVMDSVKFVHTDECAGNILEMKKDLPIGD